MKSIYSLVLGGSVVWLFVACDQQTSQRSGDFVSQPDPTAGPVEQGSQIRSKPGYKVMISEFLAVNDSITQDGQGQFSDWIELYNYGEEAVNLAGFSLTDDALNSSKWRFPERLLPAGDFLVVFASGEGGETLGELHCSFRLASDGEFLGLATPDGVFIHQYEPTYPKQRTDLSYGIGSEWEPGQMPIDFEGYLVTSTPGRRNDAFVLGHVEPVEFSHSRGAYGDRFDLELSTKTSGSEIYYTTDGSHPDINSGRLYEGPIPVNDDTVVRARAIKSQFRSSRIKTATFLLPDSGIANNGQQWDMDLELSIVSLSLPPIEFREAYVNSELNGRESEQLASIEWIDLAGGKKWAENGGIRVRREPGNSTEDTKHSFRLYFRDQYGPPRLKKSLFGAGSASAYNRLALRAVKTAGDSIWNRICHDLMGAVRQPYLRGRFCHVSINAQFWGLYELTERPGLGFAAAYFDGKPSDFDLIGKTSENNSDGAWYRVIEGQSDAWQRMLAEVKGRGFGMLEVDNFISFMLLASFREGGASFDIGDWVAIRNREGTQGFRWMLGNRRPVAGAGDREQSQSRETSGLGSLWSQSIQDPEIRIRVIDHVHNLYFSDGPLSSDHLASRIYSIQGALETAISTDRARWPGGLRDGPQQAFEDRRLEQLAWLRSLELVSSMDQVTWALQEVPVSVGAKLELGVGRGEIVYTLDGSDPRAEGGRMSASSSLYSVPIAFSEPTIVTCRVRQGDEWGPKERRAFDLEIEVN
ncbi:chitobiase/beta-hexosaminidase C-terminal domain-containing protein [bacterium]|nr:chitobiase/beta-hexosaminidase C-terminal domain-containing protein [bacterium]